MKLVELNRGLKLLFENFWIIREEQPENYHFLRRHQNELQKELRQRFGMSLIQRPQYIQLLKRPQELAPWMGEIGFTSQVDYVLLCTAMAYIEELEAGTPFMLDELVRSLSLMLPEDLSIDWTNYNHRKSLVRVVKKMLEMVLIETVQGETSEFEHSELNQEVLFVTTVQARAFLARAPQSYTEYEGFAEYWQDFQTNQHLEANQLLYQRLMLEPLIQREPENEETFTRLRNYHHRMAEYIEGNTYFKFELYRDYAAFTLEQQDSWQEVFPSRRVVDEILIQLATVLREQEWQANSYGIISLTQGQWEKLIAELQKAYHSYWSKEFSQMSLDQLSQALISRGLEWQLLRVEENKTAIKIQPGFGRLVAEMRTENE